MAPFSLKTWMPGLGRAAPGMTNERVRQGRGGLFPLIFLCL
jgi:hypothetical protein